MKNSRFVFLYILFVACLVSLSAWAAGMAFTDNRFLLMLPIAILFAVMCAATPLLYNLGDWRKEREAQLRVQNNTPQGEGVVQSFTLEEMSPTRVGLWMSVIPIGVILLLLAFTPDDKRWILPFFAMAMVGLSGLSIYMGLRAPTSFEVTPEALIIKRRWPCSSPTIYLSEIDQLQFGWMLTKTHAAPWDGKALSYPNVISLAQAISSGTYMPLGYQNRLSRIDFVMKSGEKHSVDLDIYLPSSIERLVQILGLKVKAEPVSVGKI